MGHDNLARSILSSGHGGPLLLTVEFTGTGQVTWEVDVDAAVVVTEMERQLPLPVGCTEDVGDVSLDTVLPDVPLQHVEELLRAFGGEADHAGKFAQDRAVEERLGHGAEVAGAVDEDLHVLIVAGLQLDIDKDVRRRLVREEGLQPGQSTEVVANA